MERMTIRPELILESDCEAMTPEQQQWVTRLRRGILAADCDQPRLDRIQSLLDTLHDMNDEGEGL